MKVSRISKMLIEVRMEYSGNTEQEFFLCSDVHIDNPKCDRKRFFRDMDEAKKRGAPVFIFGDLLCLMQGRYDPRSSRSGIRPEHNNEGYLDLVVKDTADLLTPYADNIIFASQGNHCTNIIKRLETSPLDRVFERLEMTTGKKVYIGGYHGFIKFVFEQKKSGIRSFLMYFHHGKFGGVVSKGVQGVARYGNWIPQADIFVSGHTHDSWIVPQSRLILKQNGEVVESPAYHIKTGTYKSEFAQDSGWAVERALGPKIIGGCWMKLYAGKHIENRSEFTLSA